jgi:hypothetical protein
MPPTYRDIDRDLPSVNSRGGKAGVGISRQNWCRDFPAQLPVAIRRQNLVSGLDGKTLCRVTVLRSPGGAITVQALCRGFGLPQSQATLPRSDERHHKFIGLLPLPIPATMPFSLSMEPQYAGGSQSAFSARDFAHASLYKQVISGRPSIEILGNVIIAPCFWCTM